MPITATANLNTDIPKLTLSGTIDVETDFDIKLFEPRINPILQTNYFRIDRPSDVPVGSQWNWSIEIFNTHLLNLHTLTELQNKCDQQINLRRYVLSEEFELDMLVLLNCSSQPSNCPDIDIQVDNINECDTDGKRHIILNAYVPEDVPGRYEWKINGQTEGSKRLSEIPSENGQRKVVLDVRIQTESTQSSVQISLEIHHLSDEYDCPPYTTTITIDPCSVPPCRTDIRIERIKILDSNGQDKSSESCLPRGDYKLEVVWNNSSNLPNGRYEWQKDGLPDIIGTDQSLTVNHDTNTHNYFVEYKSENGRCEYPSHVEIKACHDECPSLDDVQVIVSPECINGQRNVIVNAPVDPHGQEERANLILVNPDGSTDSVDSRSSSSPYTLSMNRTLSPGNYSAEVKSNSEDCENKKKPFNVPECRGTDEDGCSCMIWRILMLISIAVFSVGIILICPDLIRPIRPDIQYIIQYIIAAILILVGGIGFIVSGALWSIFCKPDSCKLKLMLAEILSVMGFVLLFVLFCPICWIIGFTGLILILIALGVFIWWGLSCRPSICHILRELLFTFTIIDIVMIIVNLALYFLLACPPEWWRIVHGAILGFCTAIVIWQMDRRNCRL